MQLGERGRLVLPAELRKELGLEVGERLIVTTEPDGSLRLIRAQTIIEASQGLYRRLRRRGKSLTDEFLAQRRGDSGED